MYRVTKILMALLLLIQTFSAGLIPVGAGTDVSKNKPVYSETFGKYDDSNIDGSPQMKLAEATSSQQVFIDKNVIFTGQQTDVTITVMADQPVSGAFVEYILYGSPLASGYTDNDGRLTCSLNPQYGGNVFIRVNGTEYWWLLAALGEYDSLLEVTANDMSGNPLAYFRLHASGEDWAQGSEAYQGVARVILQPGKSVVKLIGNDINNHGYYLLNEYTLAPREIRQVHINPITDSVQVDAQFTLDGTPLAHCNVFTENTSYPSFKEMDQITGSTDSLGHRTLHVTPDIYKLKITGNSVNGMLYLTSDAMSIQNSTEIQIPWASSNTGRLRMRISPPDQGFSINGIDLDSKWMSLQNNNDLIMSSGDYTMDHASLSQTLNGEMLWYDLQKPWGQPDIIRVAPGSTTEYNLDMTIDSITLRADSYSAVPGEPLNILTDVRTKSGYLIQGINENYKLMDIIITKPDGTSFTTRGNFTYIRVPGEIFDQWGTYTLEATGNLGPYYGAFSVSSTYTVAGTSMVDIAVNNPILAVGQDNEVAITLSQDGKPISNVSISLYGWYGYYGQGVTDENGQYKATLHPNQAEEIRISLNGKEYSGFLFAVDSEFGVVEVTVSDRESVPIENFWCSAGNERNWNSGESYKGVKRLLAYRGKNYLALSGNGSHGEFYYLAQSIYVEPGMITQLHLETSLTQEARLIFTYNDTPLSQIPVKLERTDIEGENRVPSFIGNTDFSGNLPVFVNQGVYTAYVERDDPNRESFNLYRENLQLGSPENPTVNCAWSNEDTGRLRLITNASVNEDFGVFLSMKERGFRVRKNNDIILSSGSYPIFSLSIEGYDQDGRWLFYDYSKSEQPENVIIEPNVVTEYNLDINEKNISMNVFSSVYSPGDEVRFGIDVETLSGHLLGWYNNVNMNVTVRKPNGEEFKYSTNGLRWNNFMLDRDDPAGRYEIQADVDLGPWYGGIRTVTGSFDVAEKIDVFTSNPIVKCNEPTTIELNLSQNGSPVAGEVVTLKLDDQILAEGTSDERGNFTAQVRVPDVKGDREIVVLVGGMEYRGLLYVIMPGEGLVEVSAKDINGNGIPAFSVEFNNGWGGWTDTGTVRGVVNEGDCIIRFGSYPDNSGERYYIVKRDIVTAGILNRIELDGSQTVTADITFKYDGSPIPNGELLLELQTPDGTPTAMTLWGMDEQGHMKVHLTPGFYKAGVQSNNYDSRVLHLVRTGLEINSDTALDVEFGLDETGIFKANVTDPLGTVDRFGFILDGRYIDLAVGGEAILNSGLHDIPWISVAEGLSPNGAGQNYSFSTPAGSSQFVIRPGETAFYDFSMIINEFKLQVYTKEILQDSLVEFGIEGITETGHQLALIDGGDIMDVQIIKPNGEVINKQCYLADGNYQLSPTDPSGVYTIKATIDMGPRYGAHELTTTFNYTNLPNVIGMNPQNGSVDVPVDTAIHIKFNNNVIDALKGIKNGKPEIIFRGLNGGIVNFKYYFEGNTLTIIPDKELKEDTIYILYISAAFISDGSGNTMKSDFLTCFKTQAKNKVK